jgi:hypothetical protein
MRPSSVLLIKSRKCCLHRFLVPTKLWKMMKNQRLQLKNLKKWPLEKSWITRLICLKKPQNKSSFSQNLQKLKLGLNWKKIKMKSRIQFSERSQYSSIPMVEEILILKITIFLLCSVVVRKNQLKDILS